MTLLFSKEVAAVCNKDCQLCNESVPSIYGKKRLKMLKTSITQWLTQGRNSKQILDCFREHGNHRSDLPKYC